MSACPFCGDREHVRVAWWGVRPGDMVRREYAVICDRCKATGPSSDRKAGAVKLWNQRVVGVPAGGAA